MSSLTGNMRRSLNRILGRDPKGVPFRGPRHFRGRGSQLGVTNPKAKDLLARLARERRHGNGPKKGATA